MATRSKRTARSRQKAGAAPIVEDAKLPRMGDGEPEPRRFGKSVLMMAASPKASAGTRGRMPRFRGSAKSAGERMPKKGFADQEPPKSPRKGDGDNGGERDGYVRLRVLVEEGELSVVGAKYVEGPLAPPPTITAGLAYEVAIGARQIAAGDIVDAGTWRSYPDPQNRPGMTGHHLTRLNSYEIAVRVPASVLSASALAKAQITLYRWQGREPVAFEAGRSMKAQLTGKVETVAKLKGIRLASLPKAAQAEIRKALD
jgi:hypothetical protein